jgi:hypothetical protein
MNTCTDFKRDGISVIVCDVITVNARRLMLEAQEPLRAFAHARTWATHARDFATLGLDSPVYIARIA